MKKVSVCIPCYNEEKNIETAYERVKKVLETLDHYEWEIIFEDNASKDDTVSILRKLADSDKRVKVILNTRNFGPYRSAKNCCFSATGDAVICIACDMQDPPELIPEFLKYWEEGYLLVLGQKLSSKESPVKYKLRSLYYKIIKTFSDVPQTEQITGFGIVDRKVYQQVKELDEPEMAFRNLVAELGYEVKKIPYEQEKRKEGKSSYNIWRYLDFAITSLVRTSFVPLRLATLLGVFCSFISFVIGVVYLIYKLIYWDSFMVGMAPLVIGIFFFGSVQLFFIGLLGEYIGMILRKVTKRPIVVEKERINF